MAGNIVISQINGGPIGVINAIINGNFQVNQRGVSGTVTLAAGAYGHDRWKAGASGCTYTFATVNNVTTLTITAGSLIQVIEGINLYSGTYALSWSGTAQGKIGAGSYSGSGVTGSVTGGTNLNIEFNTGTLSLVQFEPGTEVSPFERRDYGRELMMCQRYYETSYPAGYPAGYNFGEQYPWGTSKPNAVNFIASDDVATSLTLRFVVQKRTSPTVVIYSPNNGSSGFTWVYKGTGGPGNVAANVTYTSESLWNINQSLSAVNQANESYFHFTSSAEL